MKNFNFFEVNVGDHFGGNLLILIFSSSILVLFDFWCSPPQAGKYLTAATGWTQGPTHWNPCVDQFVVSNVRGDLMGNNVEWTALGKWQELLKQASVNVGGPVPPHQRFQTTFSESTGDTSSSPKT